MELVNAFKKGDWLTRSSAIVMGFGNLLRKQFIKGILFLFTETAFYSLWQPMAGSASGTAGQQ